MNDTRIGLEIVKEAVDTRAAITERYKTYSQLSKMVQVTALVEHSDFKHAVDALYYLGGGWPTENSKGRMERLLDNMIGMYRILSFVGEGHLVEEHLAKKGVHVTLSDHIKDVEFSEGDIKLLEEEFDLREFGFKPATLKELMRFCINEAMELQRFICNNADKIKLNLKPAAKNELGIEDEEFDRLFFMTKYSKNKPERVVKRSKQIHTSFGNFREAAKRSL